MRPCRAAGSTVFVACALLARVGHTQDVGQAEVLFEQGSQLVNAGQYERACPKLEAAQALVTGIGVTLYLGECYEETGRLTRAWSEFKRAEALAAEKGDSRAAIAHERAAQLWPKLSKLTITIAAPPDSAAIAVSDQGAPVDRQAWNVERPVEPGTHLVRATAPQRESWEASVEVPPGKTVVVAVPALKEMPAPAREGMEPSAANSRMAASANASPSGGLFAAPSGERDPGRTQRLAGIALLGAGAVGLVIGSVFGIEAKVQQDDSNAGDCHSNNQCNGAGLALRATAGKDAAVSTVAVVGSAVCLAGGAALYLTAPKGGLAIAAHSSVEGASVALQGAW